MSPTRYFLAAVYLTCLFGGMACVVLTLYYFFSMIGGIKPEKYPIARFLGPVVLVLPRWFTESGLKARKRFAICALLFVVCGGGDLVVLELLKTTP